MDSAYSNIYASLPIQSHLRKTRIVLLQPATSWGDEISCVLEVVALDSQPKFEALSYVWGNITDVRPILLNGRVFKVAANLESALRHLRSPAEPRPLWIDAICINQTDIAERNAQVALMRDIYFHCSGVLVWLGPADQTPPCEWLTGFTEWSDSSQPNNQDGDRIASFESMIKGYHRLPCALRHSIRIDDATGALCLMSLLAQNKHVNNNDIPFLYNHDAFHRIILALDEVMHRAWWLRQWVIQEIVLPPKATVHYGS